MTAHFPPLLSEGNLNSKQQLEQWKKVANVEEKIENVFFSKQEKDVIVAALLQKYTPRKLKAFLFEKLEPCHSAFFKESTFPSQRFSQVFKKLALLNLEEQIYVCLTIKYEILNSDKVGSLVSTGKDKDWNRLDEKIVDNALFLLTEPEDLARMILSGLLPPRLVLKEGNIKDNKANVEDYIERMFEGLSPDAFLLQRFAHHVAEWEIEWSSCEDVNFWVLLFRKYNVLHKVEPFNIEIVAHKLYGTDKNLPYSAHLKSLVYQQEEVSYQRSDVSKIPTDEMGLYAVVNIIDYLSSQLTDEDLCLSEGYFQVLKTSIEKWATTYQHPKAINLPFRFTYLRSISEYNPDLALSIKLKIFLWSSEQKWRGIRFAEVFDAIRKEIIMNSSASDLVMLLKLQSFVDYTPDVIVSDLNANKSLSPLLMEELLMSQVFDTYENKCPASCRYLIEYWTAGRLRSNPWSSSLIEAFVSRKANTYVPTGVLIEWARDKFDLDESLPDSWVATMVNNLWKLPSNNVNQRKIQKFLGSK